MLKKLFNQYGDDKISQGMKLMTYRNLIKFCEDFHFFHNFHSFDKSQLQIIYYKVAPNRCEFQTFIEILYKIQNFYFQKVQKTIVPSEKELAFKLFLDEYVIPKYKTLFIKNNGPSIERIQVLYQNYNPYENPTVCLLYENDDLLKHVFIFLV